MYIKHVPSLSNCLGGSSQRNKYKIN